MAKGSKPNNGRPPRKIKLNRSIFNMDTAANPAFRVKTLREIKMEKEAKMDAVEQPQTSVARTVSSIEASSSPVSSSSVVRTTVRSVTVNPVLDTRTVVKRELLLPDIKLTRLSADSYTRSISNKSTRAVINKESPSQQPVFTQQGSLGIKRKVSPIRLTISNPTSNSFKVSPVKRRKISPVRSPNVQLQPHVKPPSPPLQSPSPPPLDPPSPALSLGAQSDDELHTPEPLGNSRVIFMSDQRKSNVPVSPVKNLEKINKNNIHFRLGPHPTSQKSRKHASPQVLEDDRLDVMSVIADDDDLFEEKSPKGRLKRSCSQDSIFNMHDESKERGNLRSLVKNSQSKHSAGELITSKPEPKSFKIPRKNFEQDHLNRHGNFRRNSDSFFSKKNTSELQSESYTAGRRPNSSRNNFFPERSISHCPPKPTRVISKEGQPINGISIQQKVHNIRLNLSRNNVRDAWRSVKELDDSSIDVQMLKEVLKVSEFCSMKGLIAGLTDIVISVFKMLKDREALDPMTYIIAAITLTRCGKIEEAFVYIDEMIEASALPPQKVLQHFFKDMKTCLLGNPKWIIKLLGCVEKFHLANQIHVFNECLSSLVMAPVETLRVISASQWDALIAMLCSPPNIQGAVQVQSIMDKHRIPVSDQSTTKLLNIFRDGKCTKQLLDFVHLKSITFDFASLFAEESLNLRDIEAHFGDLIKTGVLPGEDLLLLFIEKASAKKEFCLIYNLFSKCKSSNVALSVSILKEMVDAMENWDENMSAAVEVYSALLQAKKKKTSTSTQMPQKTLHHHRPHRGPCFSFMQTGRCTYADRCKYSHAVEERPENMRTISQSVPAAPKFEGQDKRPQLDFKKQAQAGTTYFSSTSANNPLANGIGHSAQRFPSFQCPPTVVPMFAANSTSPFRFSQQARPPLGPRHQYQAQIGHPRPTFSNHNTKLHVSSAMSNQMPRPFPQLRATTPENKATLNRSFSWEPASSTRSRHLQSPLLQFQRPSPGRDTPNTNSTVSELQQRVEQAIASKDWSQVYLSYMEMKKSETAQGADLMLFRSAFIKDITAVGSNFADFIEFTHNEKSSVKSSHSDSANNLDPFDKYDGQFLGSLGVSLMERCYTEKKFEKGYEILHSLHAHSVNYFDCGKNFGAYIEDILPSSVAIIAVKLCLGVSQKDALLGALEVLRASNYAAPEHSTSSQHSDYRVKVLRQLFDQLFEQGHISEAYEILQHLNARPNIMTNSYVKILTHYSNAKDYDQSFEVVAEMREKGIDVNIPVCQSLYENFIKLCLTNEQDDEVFVALKEMDTRGVSLNGHVWRSILNQEMRTSNEALANDLFQRCVNLGAYSNTFFEETPWLCKLGCGYSLLEVKLIIVRHLKQLRQHLNARGGLANIKDFVITLFPRVSEDNRNHHLHGNVRTAMNENSLIVAKVLQEYLNPPLTVIDQSQKQFQSKFVVDAMSLYRWFGGNESEEEQVDGDDALSHVSNDSCISFMTRMDEFD